MTSEDTNHDQEFDIGSDHPQTDPDHDAFGYAPFAKRLAEVIEKTPSPHGLVISIHGEWGSGKSSILNFVKNYLSKLTDNNKPIVIDFNPWWFRDGDDLAGQLLAALNKELGIKDGKFKKARDLLSEYSDAIGQAATIFDPSGKILTTILHKFKNKPKSVPQLKKELSDILKDMNQRVIFMIDDIDRLSPNEIREVFKIIKALADFPNVIYLLSFDRKVVSESLSKILGIDGDAYLEKIIQLQLSLPAINQEKLRAKVFSNIETIVSSNPGPYSNESRRKEIFELLGLYIKKPRDLVRIVNSIKIQYASVANEVVADDFILIEFIKMFEPELYRLVRDNKQYFSINKKYDDNQIQYKEEIAFHQEWSTSRNKSTKKLMRIIFPRLDNFNDQFEKPDVYPVVMYDSRNDIRIWETIPRIGNNKYFDLYFELDPSRKIISYTEMTRLFRLSEEKIKRNLEESSFKNLLEKLKFIEEYIETKGHAENIEITPKLLMVLLEIGSSSEFTSKYKSNTEPFKMMITTICRLFEQVQRDEYQNKNLNAEKNNPCPIIGKINEHIGYCDSILLAGHLLLSLQQKYNYRREQYQYEGHICIDNETITMLIGTLTSRVQKLLENNNLAHKEYIEEVVETLRKKQHEINELPPYEPDKFIL